jgi:hypothetical protein
MPKEGEKVPKGVDIGGGLEQVKGVQKLGKDVKSYRPSYVTSFTPKSARDVRDSDFKFYKQPEGKGKVL